MSEFIYCICAAVSTACSLLLIQSYRRRGARVLLWVAVCFAFLALNNIFVCFDLLVFPQVDLGGALTRNSLLAAAGSVLVVGLVWEMS